MPSSNAQPPTAGLSVLIVEDDEDSREMLGELISALGHRPVLAGSATEALEADATKIDLAFIDLSLPDADGCDVARQLRTRPVGQHRLRLIALTGHSDSATRDAATRAGFDEFVVKPVFPEALAGILSR